MYTFGKVGRDPRGRQITVAFLGIVEQMQNSVRAGDDAADARWFDIEKLPKDMAFDHNQVANFAINKLKRKAIYRLSQKRRKTEFSGPAE
jgi:8-oxo-dGTP diphosphatase